MLFISGITLILSTYHVLTYLNQYSSATQSVYETPLFQSRYLKYVERVAIYIDYREKGYTSSSTFDPSATDITSIIEENENTIPIQSVLEDNQAEFDYYNAILNIDNASFEYYVKNLNTGKIYASPSLESTVKEHIESEDPTASLESYLQEVSENNAHLIINTKTRRFFTNVNRSYQYLSEENIEWVMNYISGNLIDSDSKLDDYIICTNINSNIIHGKDEFGMMYENYNRLHRNYTDSLYFVPFSFILILCFFILAVGISGYRKNISGIVLSKFDKTISETLIVISLSLAGIYYILLSTLYEFIEKYFYIPSSYNIIINYALLYPVYMFLFLSLVKRLKSNTLFRNSLSYRLLKNIIRFIRSLFNERSLTYPLASLFVLFVALQVLALYLFTNPILAPSDFLFVNLIAYIILGRSLFKAAIDISTIRNTTKNISEGYITAKIDTDSLSIAGKSLGEYVNNLGDGISAAVDEKLKSERLKTELIANVSHDIKTPLTSIINYVDLLKKENIKNERVEDYLEVLSNKSWRLKTLIEDLVEASKASSGTITLNLESLNLVELIRQSLGEFEDRFIKNQLEAILNVTDEPLFILADGRSTYRIIENIFSNANKYALSGTRIYIDIQSKGDSVIVSVKNVSANKLNINADELMERFVRGDLSRNTEGSGLGLSIAKSLAAIQNASFDIQLDGDLFKAVITFKRLYNDYEGSVVSNS